MELTKVLHMKAGDGEKSYAKNAVLQRTLVVKGKSVIEEAIWDYYSSLGSNPDPVLVVVDLGSSSGPNGISVVSNVLAAATEACRRLIRRPPAIQAFFNDLPGNDFNVLFRSLPSKWWIPESEEAAPRCFVAGVPGSFYGRLFPDQYVHLFHSAFAQHFLLQVPPELQEEGCIVNKGCVHASRSSDTQVSRAYYNQYQKDFSTFLRLRAQEMVSGGRMLLFLVARKEKDLEDGFVADVLQLMADTLMDMAKQGYLEEGKIDSFNLPTYFASLEEVDLEVRKEGSFAVKILEFFHADIPGRKPCENGNAPTSTDILYDECQATKGFLLAKGYRAVFEPLLAAHFGEDKMDVFFQMYGEALDEYFRTYDAGYPTIMVYLEKIRTNT